MKDAPARSVASALFLALVSSSSPSPSASVKSHMRPDIVCGRRKEDVEREEGREGGETGASWLSNHDRILQP